MKYTRKIIKQANGFTLTEMIVAMLIVGLTTTWAMPQFTKRLQQSEIDHYQNQVEAGFYSLRAKIGQTKSSCEINMPAETFNNYLPPDKTLEFTTSSGAITNSDRLNCCNTEILSLSNTTNPCLDGPLIPKSVGGPFRFLVTERNGSENIRIRLDIYDEKAKTFGPVRYHELTPPGTTASGSILLVRLQHSKDLERERPQLIERCLMILPTGTIKRGNWSPTSSQCILYGQ